MARNRQIERQNVQTDTDTNGSGVRLKEKKNRRDLLKLGGAAAVGAVGSLALQATQASAATGGNMIIGASNDENATTFIVPTAGASISRMLSATGTGATLSPWQGGAVVANGFPNAEGVDAFCAGSAGWGVNGQTDSGIGVRATATTGVDMAALGTGRLWQTPTAGVTGSGPPYAPNQHEQVRDVNGVLWIDGVGQNPNKWAPVQPGASFIGAPGTSIFTTSTNSQHTLNSSDGATWMTMDAVNLRLTITAPFNALALLSANTSLWTDTAGYNQDIAIFVNGVLHSWQESGGFAGTFSPNAAFVHGVYGSFLRGTVYVVEIRWKTNKPAPGVTIYSGAGTAATGFSPTRLTVQLVILS